MFYVITFVALAILAFSLRDNLGVGRKVYPLVFIFLFLLCAFRFEVGCDWFGYQNQFYYGQAFEILDATSRIRDPLWWMLIGLLNRFGLDYAWLNVVATSVAFLGLHVLARRQPDRLTFLVLLFPILLIHLGMSGIRQAAAIGVVCIAFGAFIDSRLVRFVALVILASTIHSSAMIFLLLAPLVQGRYSRARVALAGVLAVPGALLMIGSAAGDIAVSRYIGTDSDAAGAFYRVGLLAFSGLLFFIFLRRHWLNSNAPDYKLVSLGAVGMIVLCALLPISTVIADRLGYYFIPIQAVFLARASTLDIGRLSSHLLLASLAALGLSLTVWVSLSSHYQKCYVPYQTWLFGEPESRYGAQ